VNNKIQSTISFYKLCNKLKDTIRVGHKVWNIKRDRIESVADHIYGTQMLAIAIHHQFNYDLDLNKILYMLAIHELEEIIIGDLVFFQISSEEKQIEGMKACQEILKDIIGKDELLELIKEFNERKTKEAKFAYHCDKLECDIQVKLYDQEGCYDLNNQSNNPIVNEENVKKLLEKENSLSNTWIEFDRSKYLDDPVFIEIIDYLKGI
jgi:putative hydrolase of HD superfamily